MKQGARRQFGRHVTMIVWRLNVADQKTSTGGYGMSNRTTAPNPLEGRTVTETWKPMSAPLPKDEVQWRGIGLKAWAVVVDGPY